MIKVSGTAILRVNFSVELDMSEEDFDALNSKKQDSLLDSTIDWYSIMSNAEVDEFEVDDLEEV